MVGTRKFEVTSAARYGDLVHQYDCYGNHRLVHGDEFGVWTSYENLAALGDTRATTDYWDGIFPRVFRIQEIPRAGSYEEMVPSERIAP